MTRYGMQSYYAVVGGGGGIVPVFHDPLTSASSAGNYVIVPATGASYGFGPTGLTINSTAGLTTFTVLPALVGSIANVGFGLTIVQASTGFVNDTIGYLLPGYTPESPHPFLATKMNSNSSASSLNIEVLAQDTSGATTPGAAFTATGLLPTYVRSFFLFPPAGWQNCYALAKNPAGIPWSQIQGSVAGGYMPNNTAAFRLNGMSPTDGVVAKPAFQIQSFSGAVIIRDYYVFSLDNLSM